MTGELVYRVQGTTAQPMRVSTLAAAGLRERDHLQEWVLANPEILGDDVLVVTSEFDQWFSKDGRDPDRLDILGLGALRAVRASGRDVPGEVTVTGFDGVPAAERAGLTTVRQPSLDKGRAAGELLLDRGDRQRSRTLLLPTELMVRATSGPPAP